MSAGYRPVPAVVGVIGAGVVSHAYLGTIHRSPELRLKAVASRTRTSAERQTRLYGGEAVSVEALLADPEIDIVVNLAPPSLHHRLGRAILDAGKHLYGEKPFATTLEDASDLLALADRQGLRIGCAPDTFLGAAHQTARRILDAGDIGAVIGGAAIMASRGMEHWHPNPAFFYSRGGGPILDIGPYVLTQLVNLLGPVAQVAALGSTPRRERIVTHPDRAGQTIAVETPTTVNAALLFENGANVALTLSWDVWAHRRPPIELYGAAGSLANPDPNGFEGAVCVTTEDGPWQSVGEVPEIAKTSLTAETMIAAMRAVEAGIDPRTGRPIDPASGPLFGDLRGLGLIDLARALREDRAPRACGRLAFHVLETLLALESCAEDGGSRLIASRVARPAPLTETA